VPVLSAPVVPLTYAGGFALVVGLVASLLPPPQEINAMQKLKVAESRSFLRPICCLAHALSIISPLKSFADAKPNR